MTLRQLFPEGYEDYCKKLVPFELVDDLTKSVRRREDTQQLQLKPVFWHKAKMIFDQIKLLPGEPKNQIKINNINELLNGSFVVGEVHSHISSKRFLIENMKKLKKSGFSTLYLEHLYYDNQKVLDDYFNTGDMSEKLKKYLLRLDNNHQSSGVIGDGEYQLFYMEQWDKYNFTALVVAAREAGVRVVAIDVKAGYESQIISNSIASLYSKNQKDNINRLRCMNYTAQAIIHREQIKIGEGENKWVALVGNLHVERQHETPGLADIFNTPKVYMFDCEIKNQTLITYGIKRQCQQYEFNCDVCIDSNNSLPPLKMQITKEVFRHC
jgi:hypothetical protein